MGDNSFTHDIGMSNASAHSDANANANADANTNAYSI
jgi:hypothetical protein